MFTNRLWTGGPIMAQQSALGRAARRPLSLLLAGACAALTGHAVAATYTLVNLATLAQGTSTVVRGANGAGTAVGGGQLVAPVASARTGLVFERAGVLRPGGLPGNDFTNVLGANDLGVFVGAFNADVAVRAFSVPRTGASRELPPLPGDTASVAYAINNAGQAVGYSSGPAGERAVSWSAAGQVAALAGPAADLSQAHAINQRGDAVGVVGSSTGSRATLWQAGGAAVALAPLPGFRASQAASINATGDVVGYSATTADERRATLWGATGAPVDLGVLAGGSLSQAFGINDRGAVVGSSGTSEGMRAFLWTGTTGMQDLNAMIDAAGLVLTKAVGITNDGLIVALGHQDSPGAGSHEHEQPIRVVLLIPSGG